MLIIASAVAALTVAAAPETPAMVEARRRLHCAAVAREVLIDLREVAAPTPQQAASRATLERIAVLDATGDWPADLRVSLLESGWTPEEREEASRYTSSLASMLRDPLRAATLENCLERFPVD